MSALGALVLVLTVSARADARDWYVKANAKSGGNGDKHGPFNSLSQVEAASRPGDTIYVLQAKATEALDGGINSRTGRISSGSVRP